jgi:hypothetical protein
MANVLGTLTMEDLGKLRRMTRPDADMFLQPHTLSDQERKYVDALVGKDLHAHRSTSVTVQVHDPTRPLWVTAAWLAGASWRQLARLHSIAPQTVMAAADRLLISPERQSLRLRTQMSLESLDAYRKKFVSNAEHLQDLPPHEVAQWLLDNTELDNEI